VQDDDGRTGTGDGVLDIGRSHGRLAGDDVLVGVPQRHRLSERHEELEGVVPVRARLTEWPGVQEPPGSEEELPLPGAGPAHGAQGVGSAVAAWTAGGEAVAVPTP
jgi:hypothetical protein